MTLMVWIISIIGLLLVYGLNIWLPRFMRNSGYSMGSALTFLLVFNIGSILGVIIADSLADRLGEKKVVAGAFCIAAIAVLLFFIEPATLPLLIIGPSSGSVPTTRP